MFYLSNIVLPIFVILAECSNTSNARLIGGRQDPPAGWKSFGLKYKSMLFSFLRGAKVSKKKTMDKSYRETCYFMFTFINELELRRPEIEKDDIAPFERLKYIGM